MRLPRLFRLFARPNPDDLLGTPSQRRGVACTGPWRLPPCVTPARCAAPRRRWRTGVLFIVRRRSVNVSIASWAQSPPAQPGHCCPALTGSAGQGRHESSHRRRAGAPFRHHAGEPGRHRSQPHPAGRQPARLSQSAAGGLVAGVTGPVTIVTAAAAGSSQQQAITAASMAAANALHRPARALDIAPPPASDRAGCPSSSSSSSCSSRA
jgi:hypothetical protein